VCVGALNGKRLELSTKSRDTVVGRHSICNDPEAKRSVVKVTGYLKMHSHFGAGRLILQN